MKIITITNQKGGAGKTTLASLIARSIADNDKRVLCIDADPQGGLTIILGADHGPGLFELLVKLDAEPVRVDNIDLLCADYKLDKIAYTMGPYDIEEIVKDFTEYDYIIIDTPPTTQGVSKAAAIAADLVLIPADISETTIGPTLYTLDALKEVKKDGKVIILGKDGGSKYNTGLYNNFINSIKNNYLFTIPKTVPAQKAAAGVSRTPASISNLLRTL